MQESSHEPACVRPASRRDLLNFREMWVPYALYLKGSEREFGYRLFTWDEILVREAYTCWAASCDGSLTDGLLALRAAEGMMKVEFLATAPWNFGKDPLTRGVGVGLLAFAVTQSIAEGFGGVLLLSSTPESESFYEHVGFSRTGERDHEDLAVFVLEAANVERFLATRQPLRACED